MAPAGPPERSLLSLQPERVVAPWMWASRACPPNSILMHIVRVATEDAFGALRTKWSALLSAAAANSIFLTWEWQYAWWQTYGQPNALTLLLAYDDRSRLCGIAPMHYSTVYVGPLRFRTLEFIGGRHVSSEYLDFIVRPDATGDVAGAFLRHLSGSGDWDLLMGYHTPEASATLTMLRNAPAGLPWTVTRRTENPYVPAGEWDTYLSQLSSNTRRNLRHYRRALDKAGGVFCEESSLIQALPEIVRLHQLRMRDRRLPGSFASSRFLDFHQRVGRLFGERGWGRFFGVRLGDKMIAGMYGFAYEGTFSDYCVGFDPAYRNLGVGSVLRGHMIERGMADGLETDFLDPGDYKEMWKPLRRWTVSYAVGSSVRALRAYERATATRARVVQTVKQVLPTGTAARISIWKDQVFSRL